MQFIPLYPNTNISENFNSNEFLRVSDVKDGITLNVPQKLVDVIQYIRDYFNTPIILTSFYRADSTTTHGINLALDFKFSTDNKFRIKQIYERWKNQSEFWDDCRKLGLSGIGFYSSHIHIDVRTPQLFNHFNSVDEIGSYSIWDKRPTNLIEKTFPEDEKDKDDKITNINNTSKATEKTGLNLIFVITLAIVLVVFFFRARRYYSNIKRKYGLDRKTAKRTKKNKGDNFYNPYTNSDY